MIKRGLSAQAENVNCAAHRTANPKKSFFFIFQANMKQIRENYIKSEKIIQSCFALKTKKLRDEPEFFVLFPIPYYQGVTGSF
jgi:hypothetical protein